MRWSVWLCFLLALLLPAVSARADGPLLALPGSLGVSDLGQSTYTVPIDVPPGTNGMAPSLSFAYSSSGGNGIMGMGWSVLGLPSITRCAPTIAQDGATASEKVNFDSGDDFCYRGQKLVAVSGTYGASGSGCGTYYRTEIESFTSIIGCAGSSGPSYFQVKTKSGQIMLFGYTPDSPNSQVQDPNSSGTGASWLLSSVRDATGNKMVVSYTTPTSTGMIRPIEIDYTIGASQT